MDRGEAEKLARQRIAEALVVTNVGPFDDETDEEERLIRLGEGGDNETVPLHDETETAAIFYVTMSFDHVAGDGEFRATVRVTDETSEVVDFEALP